MAQTVYDIGDPITSRLKLGVVPDNTTTVAVSVTRPDGTAIPTPAISAWENVDEKVIQFYATDDGEPSGPSATAAGDWLAVWRISGTGANTIPKIYSVTPLPGTSTRPAWSPFLSEVADHVPYLTVDSVTPGSQLYLGTFTGTTAPTDEVAQRHIDQALATMSPLLTGLSDTLYPAARSVVTLRAAASLARAYPRRREDVETAAALDARANAAWTSLQTAYAQTSQPTTTIGVPYWSFPDPVSWGDTNL